MNRPAMIRPEAMLRVVGIGPGDAALLTPQARAALEDARVVVGYRLYLDCLPPDLLAGKEVISTGMMGEMERCRAAIDAATAGRSTAVVSSGDAGVYGMAGLVLELLDERDATRALDVEVVAGVPALAAGAALLGAPLMHDFAVISLSDLLTPWEVIEKRIDAAAGADFALAIYNPRSRRRDWQLPRALELVRRHRAPHTPVGVVRQAFRPEQATRVCTLDVFDPATVDMLSIVFIGNSATRIMAGRMVTPRGYLAKYGDKPAPSTD
ncbi:MAG: precorrin-3B C(17)-methyltransferase [Desulfovibrionaceae bacterium]